MVSFLQSIVDKIKGAPVAPHLHLAAFGKHPGWNDHIDDQGLETDRLIALKRLLYVQGIGANIDAGTWDKLDPPQRLEKFNHAFAWSMGGAGGDVTVGRFWASRDGKGRDKYPMVLAAQGVGMPLSWIFAQVTPLLEPIQERCRGVATAAEVIAILDAERGALQQLLSEDAKNPAVPADKNGAAVTPATVAQLADDPLFAPRREGFYRILYQIARAMPAYLAGAANHANKRPEHLRVPRCPAPAPDSTPEGALHFWLHFLLTQLAPGTSLMLLTPLTQPFVDILVGEPTPAQLVCAKAAPTAMPVASDIPYTLDEAFVKAADGFIEACRNAPAEAPIPPIPRV